MTLRAEVAMTVAGLMKLFVKAWMGLGGLLSLIFIVHPALLVIVVLVTLIPAGLVWLWADNIEHRQYPPSPREKARAERRKKESIAAEPERLARERERLAKEQERLAKLPLPVIEGVTFTDRADYFDWANRRGRWSNADLKRPGSSAPAQR